MSLEMMNAMNGAPCSCGKSHTFSSDVVVGKGVIARLPEFIQKFGAKKPFVLSDKNTYAAAGEAVCRILTENGIVYTSYSFPAVFNNTLLKGKRCISFSEAFGIFH